MAGKLEGEELITSLKQLIISFNPYLKEAGTVEQAEETLLHLEENDENFHRYDFVKRLRSNIDANLGSLIEEEVEQYQNSPHDATEGQETLVSKVTDKVINSQKYAELKQMLKHNIHEACDCMLRNIDEVFCLKGKKHDAFGQSPQRKGDLLFFSDGESSLGDSSLNQSTLMFTKQEDYQSIAENLDKMKLVEVRRDALKSLSQIPSLDVHVQSFEVWNQIKRGLQDALADPDDQLSGMAMKFFARGFSSTNPSTREIYTTLVEYLSTQFSSWKSSIPKVKNGLDVRRHETNKIIKCFRLLNEFQHQIPQYWVRYPDKFLEEVLESTLSLFAIHNNCAVPATAQMTPIHFITLLDPQAQWFIKWMHGNYSRAPMLKILEKCRAVVDNAVRACVEFCAFRKVPIDTMSEISETLSRESLGDGKRMHYTGSELEFAYFIHSLHLLGRLLCYNHGREFFPVQLKDKEVSITNLLVCLVQLVCDPGLPSHNSKHVAQLEPAAQVTNALKKLCSSEAVCDNCICKDDVTNALLAPISHWLFADPGVNPASETTLLQIADILSVIASSCRGRQHLLYGEGQDRFTKTKSSPAHTITDFAKKALALDLPAEFGPPPSNSVIDAYVYVCRQLYNTCEGLLVMYSYELHNCVAEAWIMACREVDMAATPTPSVDGSDNMSSTNDGNILLWEESLRDNLLNFAGTPKGLLLLQQTGATNECVSYMYSRYERKLQVSKCEKFGYGYMMSQVAATAPGMVALQHTGFIKALVREVWAALEVADDSPVLTPRSWPVNLIDKSAHKPFTNLLHLLSSFWAVYEVLGDRPLPTKAKYSFREMPETIAGIIDRLIMVDSEAKIHALFNYEQSHIFGLRTLSAMTSCLDTYLLLECQYKFQDILLQQQEVNKLEDSHDIIVDQLSIERNYILVKTYLIGGPTERCLPARELVEDKTNPYPYPLFCAYPTPREYVPTIATRSAIKQDNKLMSFLSGTKKTEQDAKWLDRCCELFMDILQSKTDHLRGNVLQDLLEKSLSVMSKLPEVAIFPLLQYTGSDNSLKNYPLMQMQQQGIKMAVRYGTHLKLINSATDGTEKLTKLLKQCGYYLKQQQRSVDSQLRCLQGNYVGFDWFAATIFLLMNGNLDRCWKFLYNFSTLAVSAYLWTPRLHASVHLPSQLVASGISPLFSSTSHNIELILQAEAKHVHSAFRMSGYAPAQICQLWLKQCFWNYLDWSGICHYISLCTLLGVDYQVYICVAILRHLQRDILQHLQQQDLVLFLREQPIQGFHVGDHLEFMNELRDKYRKTVLADMLNITKP